ncbi:hypothetical protein HK104_010448 [Borealophlyctis nickersoniae]|nr:hypothetical protein HK104_010448 [Borealophlyctis nickersoniae]
MAETVILITGANSGLGYGITHRLLTHYFTNPPSTAPAPSVKILLACRNRVKATAARATLIAEFFKDRQKEGEKVLEIVEVDTGCAASVKAMCDDIKKRFTHLSTLILNAGIMPISHIDLATGLKNVLTRPRYVAKTGGGFVVQPVGKKTASGEWGHVFGVNVGGHFGMVKELEPLLSNSGNGRIIWVTSGSANPIFFSPDDIQCLKGSHPYESSKYLTHLLSTHLNTTLSTRNIRSFVMNPGVCKSNIAGEHTSFMSTLIVYLMRLSLSPAANITPQNAASAAIYIHTHPSASGIDSAKVWCSQTNLFGKARVKGVEMECGDEAVRERVVKEMEGMWRDVRAGVSE